MEHKHTPGHTQGPSEDAHNLNLMNRALARSDAELRGYRRHYEARRIQLAQRLLSTGGAKHDH